jgi:hypothetical protein
VCAANIRGEDVELLPAADAKAHEYGSACLATLFESLALYTPIEFLEGLLSFKKLLKIKGATQDETPSG